MSTTNTGAATMTANFEVVISTHKTEKSALAGQRKALREGRTGARIVHEPETRRTQERFLVMAAPRA